ERTRAAREGTPRVTAISTTTPVLRSAAGDYMTGRSHCTQVLRTKGRPRLELCLGRFNHRPRSKCGTESGQQPDWQDTVLFYHPKHRARTHVVSFCAITWDLQFLSKLRSQGSADQTRREASHSEDSETIKRRQRHVFIHGKILPMFDQATALRPQTAFLNSA